MTDQCPRCGLTTAPDAMSRCAAGELTAPGTMSALDIIACRDREIANLRAFLRGATIKLERIGTSVSDLLEELA